MGLHEIRAVTNVGGFVTYLPSILPHICLTSYDSPDIVIQSPGKKKTKTGYESFQSTQLWVDQKKEKVSSSLINPRGLHLFNAANHTKPHEPKR